MPKPNPPKVTPEPQTPTTPSRVDYGPELTTSKGCFLEHIPGKGWNAVWVEKTGDVETVREVIDESPNRPGALHALKLAFVRRLWLERPE